MRIKLNEPGIELKKLGKTSDGKCREIRKEDYIQDISIYN